MAHNAKVYIACRSEEKAEKAMEELREATGKNDIQFVALDLSSFASIRKAVDHLKRFRVMTPHSGNISESTYAFTYT